MDETYELNLRDVLQVTMQQLSNTEFDGHVDYSPYTEFDPNHNRVWSNLMSADWANEEAVSSSFCIGIMF